MKAARRWRHWWLVAESIYQSSRLQAKMARLTASSGATPLLRQITVAIISSLPPPALVWFCVQHSNEVQIFYRPQGNGARSEYIYLFANPFGRNIQCFDVHSPSGAAPTDANIRIFCSCWWLVYFKIYTFALLLQLLFVEFNCNYSTMFRQ